MIVVNTPFLFVVPACPLHADKPNTAPVKPLFCRPRRVFYLAGFPLARERRANG
jgi:hypothetical protein